MKELCLQLVNAETETDVETILKKPGYWDNPEYWRYYDDNPGNWGTIGSQKASAVGALDELLINSIDAILLDGCKKRGIDPESDDAPYSMSEAADVFFGIKNGILTGMFEPTRAALAENILLFATGEKESLSLNIVDKGEGQFPEDMPNTFLSLTKRNKAKIRFLQGLYIQGGSGVIRHCGENGFKLILTRKDPQLAKMTKDSSQYWGFTITRVDYPQGARIPVVQYFAPNGNIPKFKAESLPLLPDKDAFSYKSPLEFGTFIKLYNYKLEAGLKSHVALDLNYRLSRHLPSIPYPLKIIDTRKYFHSHSPSAYCLGLTVRLDEDKKNNVEDDFPSTGTITIGNTDAPYRMYLMRKDVKIKRYHDKLGVIFEQNGQMQGYLEKSWFSTLKMDWIKDSLLIIVSINNIDLKTKTKFTMPNRERLAEGEILTKIKKDLADIIKTHPGLREHQNKRRQELLKEKISDQVFSLPTMQKLVNMSPSLSQILIKGGRITSPFNLEEVGTGQEFKGKMFPSYFKLVKEFSKDKPKHCPINQEKFYIQFETDVVNDYFDRAQYPGTYTLLKNSKNYTKRNISLFNGIANLLIELPEDVHVGDVIEFTFLVTDEHRIDDLPHQQFYVIIEKERITSHKGNQGERTKPPGSNEGERKQPATFGLPEPRPVYKEQWKDFGFDENSALEVRQIGDNTDYLINMDNKILLTELKANKKFEEVLLKQIYVDGMMIFSLLLVKEIENKGDSTGLSLDNIKNITQMLAPGLIPIVLGFSNELFELYNP